MLSYGNSVPSPLLKISKKKSGQFLKKTPNETLYKLTCIIHLYLNINI